MTLSDIAKKAGKTKKISSLEWKSGKSGVLGRQSIMSVAGGTADHWFIPDLAPGEWGRAEWEGTERSRSDRPGEGEGPRDTGRLPPLLQ